MLKFRVQRIVPPGGRYMYMVPETKVVLSSTSMSGVIEQVISHLHTNELPVPDNLRDLVEDYICRQVPAGFCYGDSDGRSITRATTLSSIRANTLSLKMKGHGLVVPGVARKRIDVCLPCAYNDHRLCPSCVGLISWARKQVGRQCPRDEWAGVCTVDVTAIAAKVHINKIAPNEDYPSHCWVGKE